MEGVPGCFQGAEVGRRLSEAFWLFGGQWEGG